MFTWGWNQRGTLGHPPETKTENIPSQVKDLANVNIVQVIFFLWLFFFGNHDDYASLWLCNGSCVSKSACQSFCSNILFLGFLIFRRLLVAGIVWLLMIMDMLILGVCNDPRLVFFLN